MKQVDRKCFKVLLKSSKDRQAFLKRDDNYIQGTPRTIVGKLENNLQQIWTDQLKLASIQRLKELNSNEKAFTYARRIVAACVQLAPLFGYFIINQNMVFFNQNKEIFAWINPDILENHVKIYLPDSHDGQGAMMRSIVTFLKLWLKFDIAFLSESKHLNELLSRFDILRIKMFQNFKPKSPQKDFLSNRKNSANFQPGDPNYIRYSSNGLKVPDPILADNRSNRDTCLTSKSPGKSEAQKLLAKSCSNKQKGVPKSIPYQNSSEQQQKDLVKNKTTLSRNTDQISDKNVESVENDFQHKTFNNVNQSTKIPMNQSLGIKSGNNYFPNRTTSNKNHPIVKLISSQDQTPDDYKQNKILIEDQKHEESEKLRKMKESLDGIGEEVNELFFSNIESEGNKEEEMKKIQEEFGSLLN